MLWINHVGSFGDTNDIPYSHFWLYHDTTGTSIAYKSYCFLIIATRLEVKLPTIWKDEKQRWEVGRVREEKRRRKRKSQKKEDPGARKSRKVAKHRVFPMICVSGGSKSRLAKVAGAEPAGQMRDEKLHAVCGAKQVCQWKSLKHLTFGALLEVEMS